MQLRVIKIAIFVSAAFVPALAAPVNAEPNELVAREPRGSPFRAVSNVVNTVGSVAGQVGSIANKVGSVVSQFSSLFGRELEPEEELFIRELLEGFYAREPQPALQDVYAREPAIHTRDLDDQLEAREVFEELD